MKTIQIKFPLKHKIEIITHVSEYTKAMDFKVWLEHYASFHTYYPDPVTCSYEFKIICDDFTEAAKIETYLATH
jgi:hypothetical protein